MNPLLKDSFQTVHNTLPFNSIKLEHFLPAIKEEIQNVKKAIENLKKNKEAPCFNNVLVPYETSAYKLGVIQSCFYNLLHADSTPELQNLAQEISPIVSEFENDILLDTELFKKVEACFINQDKEKPALNREQQVLLKKTYNMFKRNGVLLSTDDKLTLREIDKKLAKISLDFSDNTLKAVNHYYILVDKESDVEGIPENVLSAALNEALKRKLRTENEKKWAFTLQAPSFLPFMKQCRNEKLRKELYALFKTKCVNDEFSNLNNVKALANLRYERATLLGFKSHADYILEERMAKSSQTVTTFLNKLLAKTFEKAKVELEELKDFRFELEKKREINPWDYSHYYEKLKMKLFNINDEMVKPYFKLENVVDGIFAVAKKLYNLEFTLINSVEVYHPEVTVYEVHDTAKKKFIGLLYMDLYPRATKSSGAWMTSFLDQGIVNGKDERPHISIVCNLTPPSKEHPSLLSLSEVTTLFHEFGHALHGLLSENQFKTIGGTHVFWDFVELPSQIMENWAQEKECLDLFAKHIETGEVIPAMIIASLKKVDTFHAALAQLTQIQYGLLDFGWHGGDPRSISDVVKFEDSILKPLSVYELFPNGNFSCSFGHIFSGGYSAGYYSYKWAEVLDADAFELFKERGIFNQEVSSKFREHILSKGGSSDPLELYIKFRGRAPDPDALLRRQNLL